ncbi:hypothetical protein CC80DRAFT_90966, partial [Byssothecium circinans]
LGKESGGKPGTVHIVGREAQRFNQRQFFRCRTVPTGKGKHAYSVTINFLASKAVQHVQNPFQMHLRPAWLITPLIKNQLSSALCGDIHASSLKDVSGVYQRGWQTRDSNSTGAHESAFRHQIRWVLTRGGAGDGGICAIQNLNFGILAPDIVDEKSAHKNEK